MLIVPKVDLSVYSRVARQMENFMEEESMSLLYMIKEVRDLDSIAYSLELEHFFASQVCLKVFLKLFSRKLFVLSIFFCNMF